MELSIKKLSKDRPYLFFSACALAGVVLISVIFGTIFWMAYPVISKVGITDFIFGTTWRYDSSQYGLFYFIIGTLSTTVLTMIMAVPLGLLTAVYLAEFAHPKIREPMKTSIELLVGIPSVVYGLFGIFILRIYLRDDIRPIITSTIGKIIPLFKEIPGNEGESIILAALILTVMIIPTIISLSEISLRSVSKSYREASAALGATKFETIQKVVIPVAMPGILAGVTLGMTRAMGETMAIVMLTGNVAHVPSSIFDTGYAMSSLILNDIKMYLGADEPTSALFGVAAVLFVIETFFILIVRMLTLKTKNAQTKA